MNYWTRLRDVVTFLVIWLALPIYLAYKVEDGWLGTILIMWIPAMIITIYLAEET